MLHLFRLRFRWYRHLRLRMRGVPRSVLSNAGDRFSCGPEAFFRPGEIVQIGTNVFIGRRLHLAAPCRIGNDVLIASSVSFVGGDHAFRAACIVIRESGGDAPQPIIVGDDVWIGHGAIVLAGVRIGRGAIVAAGSIVTKDVPECTIVAGNPARFVRQRFNNAEATEHHLRFLSDRYAATK